MKKVIAWVIVLATIGFYVFLSFQEPWLGYFILTMLGLIAVMWAINTVLGIK